MTHTVCGRTPLSAVEASGGFLQEPSVTLNPVTTQKLNSQSPCRTGNGRPVSLNFRRLKEAGEKEEVWEREGKEREKEKKTARTSLAVRLE